MKAGHIWANATGGGRHHDVSEEERRERVLSEGAATFGGRENYSIFMKAFAFWPFSSVEGY